MSESQPDERRLRIQRLVLVVVVVLVLIYIAVTDLYYTHQHFQRKTYDEVMQEFHREQERRQLKGAGRVPAGQQTEKSGYE